MNRSHGRRVTLFNFKIVHACLRRLPQSQMPMSMRASSRSWIFGSQRGVQTRLMWTDANFGRKGGQEACCLIDESCLKQSLGRSNGGLELSYLGRGAENMVPYDLVETICRFIVFCSDSKGVICSIEHPFKHRVKTGMK